MFTKTLIIAALIASAAACGNSSPTGENEGSSTPTTGADLAAYCAIEADLDDFGSDLATFDPNDPESMRTFFDGMTDLLGQSVAVAPVEVKADLEKGLALFVEMKVELENVDYDFSKITPEVAQRFAEVGQFFQNSKLAEISAQCDAGSRTGGGKGG